MIKTVGVYGGLGKMGGYHAKRLKDEHPEIDVHIFDLIGATTSHECDAYIIATPSETHYEIAKELLEKGKHVLVEKPLTFNFLQATTLEELAEQNDATLLVSHTQRYNPAFLAKQSELCGATKLEFTMSLPYENRIENLVFDVMIHGLELAMFLTGETVATQYLTLSNPECIAVACSLMLGNTECYFNVAYNTTRDIRRIRANHIVCDLTEEIPGQPDALSSLHTRFLELCQTGETPEDIKYSIGAVAVAEIIQKRLFG